MQVELLHTLQLILMLVIIITVACHVVLNLRSFAGLTPETLQYSEIISGYDYSKALTVVECESYHKYQIWRFYLFS